MKNINHRIVHFDLKGAPWKVSYLKEVILLVKRWGATGILFEWEDSFPYSGSLMAIGSLKDSSGDGLYSEDEVKKLLQFTAANGLMPIQLIQSFGHLEFVLKHEEFSGYRELLFFPSVLCPTRPGGRALVVSMLKQALAMQPDAKFIHIGADEVWHYNKCDACNSQASAYGVDSLFINHIKAIVTEVNESYPNVNILIWDDMMRGMQEESLLASEISKYLTPVVWHYGPVGGFSLNAEMWLKYDKCFPQVWIASAFKGANGSCQMLSSVEYYVSNQEAWLQQIRQLQGQRLQVTGVILTGWSRFDHYATFCELLPVSLPSLISCLKMWTKQDGDRTTIASLPPARELPGAACARAVRDVHAARSRALAFVHGDMVGTWMNPWQLSHNYTTGMQLMPIISQAKLLAQELEVIRVDVSSQLLALTGPRSADEWAHSLVAPAASQLQRLAEEAARRAPLAPAVRPRKEDIVFPES